MPWYEMTVRTRHRGTLWVKAPDEAAAVAKLATFTPRQWRNRSTQAELFKVLLDYEFVSAVESDRDIIEH